VLEQLFQELNQIHFSGELPLPSLRWNSRLSSSAGRFCPGSRNPIQPRPPEIEVASYLRTLEDGMDHIRDTLLHEMVHYFLWHHRQPYGHTPEFHRILKRVGARRYNSVPKLRPVKHWYQCPGCRVVIPARRKIRNSACAPCCKKYNHGEYTDRFRLIAVSAPPPTPPGTPQTRQRASEQPVLPPEEIVRRLEELKRMLLGSSQNAKKPAGS
jgi:predicted SprT family Zn-dependent metalloprotease